MIFVYIFIFPCCFKKLAKKASGQAVLASCSSLQQHRCYRRIFIDWRKSAKAPGSEHAISCAVQPNGFSRFPLSFFLTARMLLRKIVKKFEVQARAMDSEEEWWKG